MTLKCGIAEQLFSAARRSVLIHFRMHESAVVRIPSVSSSIGGEIGRAALSALVDGRHGGGRCARLLFLSATSARGTAASVGFIVVAGHTSQSMRPMRALVFVARVALRLFGLRLVVLLGKSAYPRQEFNRQRHAVHFFAAVHPARALVIADRHPLGPRDLVVHAPQHEHFRLAVTLCCRDSLPPRRERAGADGPEIQIRVSFSVRSTHLLPRGPSVSRTTPLASHCSVSQRLASEHDAIHEDRNRTGASGSDSRLHRSAIVRPLLREFNSAM